jgi:hypothetical protein
MGAFPSAGRHFRGLIAIFKFVPRDFLAILVHALHAAVYLTTYRIIYDCRVVTQHFLQVCKVVLYAHVAFTFYVRLSLMYLMVHGLLKTFVTELTSPDSVLEYCSSVKKTFDVALPFSSSLSVIEKPLCGCARALKNSLLFTVTALFPRLSTVLQLSLVFLLRTLFRAYLLIVSSF